MGIVNSTEEQINKECSIIIGRNFFFKKKRDSPMEIGNSLFDILLLNRDARSLIIRYPVG